MKTIFACGPIRGVERKLALAWRHELAEKLHNSFHVLHALRGREEKETMPDPRAAVIRDKSDILRSDILVVNDTLKDVSMVGTSMEIIFAHMHNKTIIVFGDAHAGNYFYDAHIHLRVKDLDEAVELLTRLFI